MRFERASGVLMHPTSFPGPYGIGDIGPQAFEWVSFLAASETSLWQVLPLGPTGYGDSPYQCFSAFAGNPYLISPQALLADDLLHPDDLVDAPQFPDDQVDFGAIIPFKLGLLDRAYHRFGQHNQSPLQQEFADFRQAEAHWLSDFAIFMAIKEAYGGGPWIDWPQELRQRQTEALEKFIRENAVAIERHTFRQFVFFRQWKRLRDYAHSQGIQIIGDIPIFVAHDSADVWANPELFYLDQDGNPTVVAGVPPDYFSPTGQLWGNPLYRWDVHANNDYSWWISRFRAVLSMVDIVRLDHFRGFAGYWEIPGDAKTAEDGQWVPGPGTEFLRAVQKELGELPIIAEDLGVITPDVVELREGFNLPGMKVLVFAFDDDASNPFLPHNFTPDCVVYTGTHDNDTVLGWYQRVNEKERDFSRRYLARSGQDISWDMIRAAWSSVGVMAVAPTQDLLGLDNSARMNYPSTLGGNWVWRMAAGSLTEALRARLSELNRLYGRASQVSQPESAEQ